MTKKGVSGGIEDIGNFKEGFCWKVVMDSEDVWIMCSDSIDDKEIWISAIRELKGSLTAFEEPPKKIEGTVTLGHEMDGLESEI